MTVNEKKEILEAQIRELETVEIVLNAIKNEKKYNAMVWDDDTQTYRQPIESDWNYSNLILRNETFNDIIKLIEKKYL